MVEGKQSLFTVSSVLLVILIALYAAQLFPLVGIILMFTAAFYWLAGLLHVFMLAVIIESYFRIIPRLCLIVPLAFYGGYYVYFVKQEIGISAVQARLQNENAPSRFTFDSSHQALVLTNAGAFVQAYRVPVAYSEENAQAGGMTSYRLFDKANCMALRKGNSFHSRLRIKTNWRGLYKNTCVVGYPEATNLTQVKIVSVDPSKAIDSQAQMNAAAIRQEARARNKRSRSSSGAGQVIASIASDYDPYGIIEGHTDIEIDGKIVATVKTAAVNKLSLFPMFYFGCGLNGSAASWDCFSAFGHERKFLNTLRDEPDIADANDLIARLVGISEYTPAELTEFKTDPSNLNFLAIVQSKNDALKVAEVNDTITEFKNILAGKDIKPSVDFAYVLSRYPDRVASDGIRIIWRLKTLISEAEAGMEGGRRHIGDQIYALSGALVVLTDAEFQMLADEAFKVVKSGNQHIVPSLYVRAGSAGKEAAEFYIREFQDKKSKGALSAGLPTYAALAICRLTDSGMPAVESLKEAYLALKVESHSAEDYRQALVVALLQLGQLAFLEGNPKESRFVKSNWTDRIMDKAAKNTSIGPNNCMIARWPDTGFLPKSMEPVVSR